MTKSKSNLVIEPSLIAIHIIVMTPKECILISAIIMVLGCSFEAVAKSDVEWLGGTVFDFGEIGESEGAVSHRFAWRNLSSEAMSVLSATGKCSCTTATFAAAAVQASDTSSVVVTFDPKDKVGDFKQRVTVRFGSQPAANYLFVKGRILTSQMRIRRDFPIEVGQVRISSDTLAIDLNANGARSKISVSLPCVNKGDTTIEPKVLGEVPGIETEVIPAKVPPGERFSLVFSGKRKALQKLTGNHNFRLCVGESEAEVCSITISIK